MSESGTVPDLLEVDVPVGGRALVVSDLRLEAEATPTSTSAADELARTVDAWEGPGVLIFAGNLFELLTTDDSDPGPALAAHPRFTRAVRSFREGDARRVICLPGSRDGRLAWDERAARALGEAVGAERALAVSLRIATGAGTRVVRVEPGHRFDPRHAYQDPRNPADTPLGHHVAREILPSLGPARATWLAGVERLADEASFPRLVVSRLIYRRAARYAWWLLIPFGVAAVLKLPIVYAFATRHARVVDWTNRAAVLALTTIVELLLVAVGVAYVSRRAWAAVSGFTLGERDRNANDGARAKARALVAAGGAGLVTGHTLREELTHLGSGFYANAGAGTELVDECPSRFGLPPVFLARRQLSWVELDAGTDLHVRLLHSRVDLPGTTLAERLIARRRPGADARPSVVASFPQGATWPQVTDASPQLRRVRRWAATAIATAGVLNMLSALTPPLRERLETTLNVVPLGVSQAAGALVALAGVALLLLARGVHRGQRQAWSISLVLLAGSALLHVVKAGDVEEAVIAGAVAAYLLTNRRAFAAAVDRPSVRLAAAMLAGGAATATLLATGAVEFVTTKRRPHRMPLPKALGAALQRLVGVKTVPLPRRLDLFLSPAMLAVGVGLAAVALWLAFRPVVTRRHSSAGSNLERARDIVKRHASGTLDYFALRTDKHHVFFEDSVVAYGVYGGVCLVSPDPIGPEAERDEVWARFRRFADEHGWSVAVLGAAEEWLPIYRASGMHDMYTGDEGVVDVTRFSLEGGRHKGLRQAVNRIAKYGYTISFHDPANASVRLRAALRDLMAKSRRGELERGFSMTLGRIFDPGDQGLLLAVAHAADGLPVAFCQFVPAPGIDGYSLDLMRRDQGEHPNGLLDFVVVQTIHHLRDGGMRGLGLNFATMRAVLAGESGDNLPQRVERWLLRRMSGSMQIESLWRFNAKYDPTWQPRYAVYDSPEHAVAVALAIARAESFWELPLIGRFLVQSDGGAVGGGGAETPEDQPARTPV